MNGVLQIVIFFVILLVLAAPLGIYCAKVMNGEKTWLSPVLNPLEVFFYKILKIDQQEDMPWKKYAACVLVFNGLGAAAIFMLAMLQHLLFLNPAGIGAMSWDLAFNTAVSFTTNTDWQAYSGESQASYLTQMLGLTVQNFASAATALAVLFACIRGFVRVKAAGIGNFWVDFVRSVVHVLLPISLVVAILLVSQGVPQNFSPYTEVDLLQPVTLVTENEDGSTTKQVLTKGVIPQGPAAGQVAIKQVGTNGGGYFGVNSAHPLENPTQFSNFLEMLMILLIPMALCFTFGRNIGDMRQGKAIFMAMLIMLLLGLGVVYYSELQATPQLLQNGAVDSSVGNMEGKEVRAGIATSSVWIAAVSATSNGSVNAMIDSFTPLGGLVPMLNIQLGEVVFGGVGCGLYGMLGFIIVAVFLAGMMVGRTPEYLKKKITAYDIKMAMYICLTVPVGILLGSAVACMVPAVADSMTNSGAHGFSEILYAYSSASGNNGSAFGGFNANTPFLNLTLGLLIILGRYVPLLSILAIAGSFAAKKQVAVSAGTLATHDSKFVFLLIIVVLIVGALSFFPALALGPIAEYFQMFL